MNTSKPIHIFASGKRPDSNGIVFDFTDVMLAATAKAYDPKLHEAPFVKGHPKTDDPAYGWAESLVNNGSALLAVPRQVDPAFAEDVKAGRWKKRSASFYPPDHPNNPVPGVFYLKHVGFLGAVPPAVKGMPDTEFAEPEKDLLTFAEDINPSDFADWDDVTVAQLFRNLRDWMIGKSGQDEADKVLPGYSISSLEQSAMQDDDEPAATAPAFSEKTPNPKGDEMSAEDKARLAALEAENATLKAKQVEFAEAEKKRRADALHTEHVAFAEVLIGKGKLLPAHKGETVAMMDHLANQEQVVEFGEGDTKKPLLAAFKTFLEAQPKQVEFAEVGAAGDKTANAAAAYSAPPGYTVDAGKMETHVKALAYAEQNKCDYVTAVKAVEKI